MNESLRVGKGGHDIRSEGTDGTGSFDEILLGRMSEKTFRWGLGMSG